MRNPTDYRKLRNRCSVCGHRMTMHSNGLALLCNVVNGDEHDRTTEHPCKCPKANDV